MEISPEPTDEEAAAIVTAVEAAWPKPTVVAGIDAPPRLRFSGRWWSKPIPISRRRPW
jgi:hypothetical protein